MTAALFGLDDFTVLTAADAGGELELLVETTADLVACPGCGAVARAQRPACDLRARLADREAAGGDLLGRADLVLCTRALTGVRRGCWTFKRVARNPRRSLTDTGQKPP